LAIEYALTKPPGLEKLVLSSPLLDSKLWVEEADKLKNLLPVEVATSMREHEQAGTTGSDDYKQAYKKFTEMFLCRLNPYPDLLRLADAEAGAQVYETMWGPSEAYATGTLKEWSSVNRLKDISYPTLLLSGKYDEATPAQIEIAHKSIPGSKWILLENSSHTSNLEEPERYLRAVDEFLSSRPSL